MATKRIERKDLVAPDAILSVVKELETLEDVQKNILEINKELAKTQTFKNGKEVKEFNETIKSINATSKSLAATEKERLKLEKQLNESTDEAVRGKLRLQKANKEQRDVLRDLIVLEDKEAGTLAKLNARNRQLRRERERLNLETEQGRKRLDEINKSLDKNNQQIKENSDVLKQQRLNVGNYKDSVKEALNETDLFGISLSGISETLSTFVANPLTAATAGLAALGAVYTSSAAGARDLESATTRLGTVYTGFANSLARLAGADGRGGGILDKLSQGLLNQIPIIGRYINAWTQARVDAVNALTELRVAQAESDRDARRQLDTAEELRQFRDDETQSIENRIAANETLIDVINEREAQQLAVLQQRIDATRELLKFDEDNVDLRVELINLEEEFADKQEENEGFRSEALANRNSLRREENALVKESIKVKEEELKIEEGLSEGEEGVFDADLDAQVQRDIESLKQTREKQEEEEKIVEESLERQTEAKQKAAAEDADIRRRELEEQREANKRFAEQTLQTLGDAFSEASRRRIEAIEEEEREVEKNIDRQERRAEQGLENTLAFEQQKAAELEKQREEEAEREEKRQKVLNFFSALTEYSKQDPDSAVAKAVVQTAVAETVSAFLYDGTDFVDSENTQKWRSTGRDDFIAALHGGERVINSKDNARLIGSLGHISNDDLIDIAIASKQGQAGYLIDFRGVEQGLINVENAVRSSGNMLSGDELGNIIDTRIENKLRKRTTYKRRGL